VAAPARRRLAHQALAQTAAAPPQSAAAAAAAPDLPFSRRFYSGR